MRQAPTSTCAIRSACCGAEDPESHTLRMRVQEEVADKQAALARLDGSGAGTPRDPRRIMLLQASMKDLQERIAAAKEQYKVLLSRNQAELARLNLQRASGEMCRRGRSPPAPACERRRTSVWQSLRQQPTRRPATRRRLSAGAIQLCGSAGAALPCRSRRVGHRGRALPARPGGGRCRRPVTQSSTGWHRQRK